MGECVHSIPLFIVFPRNEHGKMPHENTPTKREPVLSRRKKGIVEVSDCTKRARKLFKRPHSRIRSANHNSRIAEATGLDWFVKCGMYALANSWVEVVFHFSVTTSYALTEFVVFWRLNFFSLFRVDAGMRSDNNQQPLCILSRQHVFFYFHTLPPLMDLCSAWPWW